MRALLGSMPELRLYGIDRMAAGDRLARDRVTPKGMVVELLETKCALHFASRPLIAVDVPWERAC